jgi:cysteine desulfurase
VRAIGRLAKQHGVIFFCDAAQAVGKVPVNVQTDGIDLLAISGHKIYGPKGVGALYVRRRDPRVRLSAQMDGGGHEKGRRSGTLNVPAIVGLGAACGIADAALEAEAMRVAALRDRLEAGLLALPEVYVNGNRDHRLPQTTNLSFRFTEGEGLMMGTNKDIALSSGSACTSAVMEPSYVLKAMGLSDEMAGASLRFGLGRWTTEEAVDYTVSRLSTAITEHRERSMAWAEYLANKR